MKKTYRAEDLRLVYLLKSDSTFLGYDIVEVRNYNKDWCYSVFDETKQYPYSDRMIISGRVTAVETTHEKFGIDRLKPEDGMVSFDNIREFALANGTNQYGQFYLVNFDQYRKYFDISNLRLVSLMRDDAAFIGYDIVRLEEGQKMCVSAFDESKRYPYAEDLEKLGHITALQASHYKYDLDHFTINDRISKEALERFVLSRKTDKYGRFYFPNYEGAKVKKYGTSRS